MGDVPHSAPQLAPSSASAEPSNSLHTVHSLGSSLGVFQSHPSAMATFPSTLPSLFLFHLLLWFFICAYLPVGLFRCLGGTLKLEQQKC